MNITMPKALRRAIALGLSAGLLAACAGTPQRPPELMRLQAELDRLHTDPAVVQYAPVELRAADNAVAFLVSEGHQLSDPLFDHNIYLAQRMVGIAEATGHGLAAEARIDALAGERELLVSQARALEADRARSAAARARADADQARYAANRAITDAERERLAAMQARELAQRDIDEARRDAEMARLEAERARQQLVQMETMITELKAEQTDRGLVVTLDDVLFEVDRAELKPGAMRNLRQLADALIQYPDTEVKIEGHTDSTGSESYNEELSERRAAAVRNYLLAQGVDSARLDTLGLGESAPVATNATAAGRQQNRRVEVVIKDESAGLVRIEDD
jgi:outer membrane protein OmpA-like peptidoglycan-associated protein